MFIHDKVYVFKSSKGHHLHYLVLLFLSTVCHIMLFIYAQSFIKIFLECGKCSKISNTLKLRTPKIIAGNNF